MLGASISARSFVGSVAIRRPSCSFPAASVIRSAIGYWTNQVDRYTTTVLGSHRWTGYVAWDPRSNIAISTKCAPSQGAACPQPHRIPVHGCANKNRPALILRRMTDAEIMRNFGKWEYMNQCYYDEKVAGRTAFPVHADLSRAHVLLRTEPLPPGVWKFAPGR